jgi:hypothetical protein
MGALVGLVQAVTESIPGRLLTGFLMCLLLVFAVDGVRHGAREFWIAVVGLSLGLLGRAGADYMPGLEAGLLQFGGVGLACLPLLYYLLTEEVPAPESSQI